MLSNRTSKHGIINHVLNLLSCSILAVLTDTVISIFRSQPKAFQLPANCQPYPRHLPANGSPPLLLGVVCLDSTIYISIISITGCNHEIALPFQKTYTGLIHFKPKLYSSMPLFLNIRLLFHNICFKVLVSLVSIRPIGYITYFIYILYQQSQVVARIY